jgi:hypothetical protein
MTFLRIVITLSISEEVMSSGQVEMIYGAVIYGAVLFIFFSFAFMNVHFAKRKIGSWKKGSTVWFLRSIGSPIIGRSASAWVSLFGYNKREASRLATYQLIAFLEIVVTVVALFVTLANLQSTWSN